MVLLRLPPHAQNVHQPVSNVVQPSVSGIGGDIDGDNVASSRTRLLPPAKSGRARLSHSGFLALASRPTDGRVFLRRPTFFPAGWLTGGVLVPEPLKLVNTRSAQCDRPADAVYLLRSRWFCTVASATSRFVAVLKSVPLRRQIAVADDATSGRLSGVVSPDIGAVLVAGVRL